MLRRLAIVSGLIAVTVSPLSGGLPSRFHFFAHAGNGAAGEVTIRTTFQIFNGGSETTQIVLRFSRDDGTPWLLEIDGQRSALFMRSIARGGTLLLSTDGSGPIEQGSVILRSDNQEVGAVAFFEIREGEALRTQAAVESDGPARAVDVFARVSSGTNSGVAIASMVQEGTVALELTLRDQAGNTLASTQATLPPRGHLARFIAGPGGFFPDLTEVTGSLQVRASGPVTLTTLQQTGLILATLPVVRRVSGGFPGGS